jgi:hypothetical protein
MWIKRAASRRSAEIGMRFPADRLDFRPTKTVEEIPGGAA